ncbi:hypothetical protein [Clavibacter zhangzhiyongii]|uniref:Uncharacterized protein n=1 Tax=Clavibacter zhangzhiyongii TaxID=2768071 RepID=A0A7L7Z3T6_9MICO|nr:hypothetical protein [Clavibacter zhangzhiyongii]QOD44398.1 hypothetical protein H9X71_03345 [Clavibacter zhangzhiyongii]
MRSTHPIPGDPWPHDMVLRIEDEPRDLTSLLFVREAWRLPIDDVPALDAIPDVGSSARPAGLDEAEAVERWRTEWARVWPRLAVLREAMRAPEEEAMRLLRDIAADGQHVGALSDERGIDREAFDAWHVTLRDDHRLPLAEHPERIRVTALADAWRHGLESIVQLPYAGFHAERIDPATLVVSRTARHDPEMYRRALAAPIGGGPS